MEMDSSERYAHLQNVDALVTAQPHVCIGISTADCVPVLLYDPKHRVIGAAHAGWRGMVGHILAHTIERMRTLGTNPRDLRTVVGPCIGPDSFEVGEEVVDAFLQAKFPPSVVRRGFFRRPHIDLWAAQCIELGTKRCAVGGHSRERHRYLRLPRSLFLRAPSRHPIRTHLLGHCPLVGSQSVCAL